MFIFFFCLKEHIKTQGMMLPFFLKRLFSTTINCLLQNFGAIFSSCDNFFMHKKEPEKKKAQRDALHLDVFFQTNDVKRTRTENFWIENDQFLALVWSTSPLNVKISGSKFYHRLSIVGSTYSPNFT